MTLLCCPKIKTHLYDIRTVFQRLKVSMLSVNGAKCQFISDKIKYFGQVLTPEGISVDPQKDQCYSGNANSAKCQIPVVIHSDMLLLQEIYRKACGHWQSSNRSAKEEYCMDMDSAPRGRIHTPENSSYLSVNNAKSLGERTVYLENWCFITRPRNCFMSRRGYGWTPGRVRQPTLNSSRKELYNNRTGGSYDCLDHFKVSRLPGKSANKSRNRPPIT